jgi:hypothetical protein
VINDGAELISNTRRIAFGFSFESTVTLACLSPSVAGLCACAEVKMKIRHEQKCN